jgi:hypothetical protein
MDEKGPELGSASSLVDSAMLEKAKGMAPDVAKLAQIIGRPDAKRVLKEPGVAVENLPPQALSVLRGMSEEELRVFAKISQELAEAGMSLEVPVGDRPVGVFFF